MSKANFDRRNFDRWKWKCFGWSTILFSFFELLLFFCAFFGSFSPDFFTRKYLGFGFKRFIIKKIDFRGKSSRVLEAKLSVHSNSLTSTIEQVLPVLHTSLILLAFDKKHTTSRKQGILPLIFIPPATEMRDLSKIYEKNFKLLHVSNFVFSHEQGVHSCVPVLTDHEKVER